MPGKTEIDEYELLVLKELRKFWGIDDYKREHLGVLIEREKYRIQFHYQSPQIHFRTTLVEWMKKIAALKKLDFNSIHLAVYILDVFMDNHDIVIERLHLLALVCLLLATKFEERDANILKVPDINKLVENRYLISDFNAMEVLILKYLDWNLLMPTAVHFVNFYVEYLITDEDASDKYKISELWIDAKNIANSYLDYTMKDVMLMQSQPSLVGAAIMAVTRINLQLAQIWPARLSFVTGFKHFDLKVIINRLKKVKQQIEEKKEKEKKLCCM